MNGLALLLTGLVLTGLALLGFRYLGEWMFAFILTGALVGLIWSVKPKFGKKGS